MKSTIFFLIALIVVSCNAQFLKGGDSSFTSLSEVDNHNFGNMVLSMVSIQLSTEAPIEDVVTLLNDVKTKLEKDQEADDAKNATQQAFCESEEARLTSNIKTFTQKLKTSKEIKATNEDLLKTAKINLADTKTKLAKNRRQYKEGEELRAKNHEDWKVKVTDHKEAIAAVDAATQLIEKLRTGAASFIQLKGHFAHVMGLLEKHRNSHPLYAPVIETLAQLATSADQEMVAKILDLFGKLRAALVESRKTEDATEESQATAWKKRSALLKEEEARLVGKKKNLETNIATYTSIIENQTKLIEEYSNSLEKNKEELKNRLADCAAKSARYLKDQAERTREVAIVAKVIVHVEKKLGGMKDYLKARVNKF